ncbi:Methylase involved in ubiquinone/menaquinone biosynthesis [Paenibacillus uliginis N3/975]|uniref:Methylase involved in ubiquinone/menaquinone biosynthesis n=1 Tax=Paenibacillus uliginis N3/975 TaxID=1313296 RepID=A0A1X7HHE6_9BACL|nr:Methylase involved in ubiquinone/menaquinone biosynthesis [Paenibacillus uliginis N3/975]
MISFNTSFAPQLYHWFVRPKWFTKKYIHDHVQSRFTFNNKVVLDFGSGTGANCSMVQPIHYVGTDPDAKRIDYARRQYPNHTFHVLENGRLPVDNESVDYILIIAVLHHISSEQIASYMKEFKRILKPDGTIIVMEPCKCKKKPVCNWFMNLYDNGEYIRNEEEYIQFFRENEYNSHVINRFRKCFLYHELFFSATPKSLSQGGNKP